MLCKSDVMQMVINSIKKVINWFKNRKKKKKYILMQLDTEEFYPLISKKVLLKVIT